MTETQVHIGFLLFPRMTQLDFTGPFEVLVRAPNAKVSLIWKNLEPIASDTGLRFLPNQTLADCPPLDLICVPGGPGQIDLMDDAEVLDFLRAQGAQCRYVTSVCTGSLLLGAAGLLQGYKATTYWAAVGQLPFFGAEPIKERVVRDRNRITGGGVTAGIDFAFAVVAEIWGEETAKMIQLGLEYNPTPPFQAGSPEQAGEALTQKVIQQMLSRMQSREDASKRAAIT